MAGYVDFTPLSGMRPPNAPFPMQPGSPQIPASLLNGTPFSPNGYGPFVMDQSGTPLQPNTGGWRRDGGSPLPPRELPPLHSLRPRLQPNGPSTADLIGILIGKGGSPKGVPSVFTGSPSMGVSAPQGGVQMPGGTPMGSMGMMPSVVSPEAPVSAPRPATAQFMAAKAPAGTLASPPIPPERPLGLGTSSPPAAPEGNLWDTYNQTGNPADFVRADKGQAAPRQIGPGSWLPDASKMGNLIDKNSVVGRLLAMKNAKDAPGSEPPPTGLLPQLYRAFSG